MDWIFGVLERGLGGRGYLELLVCLGKVVYFMEVGWRMRRDRVWCFCVEYLY